MVEADRYHTSLVEKEDELDEATDALEEQKKNLDITDLVREQLKSFNPRLLSDDNDLLAVLTDEDSEEVFLSRMRDVFKMKELWQVCDYIKRDLILFAAKEGKTLEEINFSRASINGIQLLHEEVERFNAIYDERHPPKETFDEHQAL